MDNLNNDYLLDTFEGPIYDNMDELAIFEDQDEFIGKAFRKIKKKIKKKKPFKKALRTGTSLFTAAPRAIGSAVSGKKFKLIEKDKPIKKIFGRAALGKGTVLGAALAGKGVKKLIDKRKPKTGGVSKPKRGYGQFADDDEFKQRIRTVGGSIIDNTNAKLLPVKPFKPAMVSALKNDGVAVSKNDKLSKVANLFYNRVVKKDSFEHAHFEYDLNSRGDHADVAIDVIVDAIISYFTKSKEKADRGEDLSRAEEIAAGAADKIENKVEKEATEQGKYKLGSMFTENWQLIASIIGAIIVLFFLAGKGSK